MQPAHFGGWPRLLANSDPETAPDLESSTTIAPSSALHSDHISHFEEELRDGQLRPNSPRPTPKSGRKRPNQAQRRQMNTELSIPIDTRGPAYNLSHHSRPQYYSGLQSSQHSQKQTPFQSQTPAHPTGSQTNSLHGQMRRGYAGSFTPPRTHQSDWGRQHSPTTVVSADDFSTPGDYKPSQSQSAVLYNPAGHRPTGVSPEVLANQSAYLDQLCHQVVIGAAIGEDEIAVKENFRKSVESICQTVIARHEHQNDSYARIFQPETVKLTCFGSLASGFATKASDMDLGLLSPMSWPPLDSPESPIPRIIEGVLLAAGFGARLLTKTRIPIIKLCEHPDKALRQSLLDARQKWEDGVDQEERDPEDDMPEDSEAPPAADTHEKKLLANVQVTKPPLCSMDVPQHEVEMPSLRQSSSQSLASYYNNAKRLLRRLNGRDITQSNYQDFTEADLVLLDRVASTFVDGLYDTNLKNRILRHPSFHVGYTSQFTNYRTLFGVYLMVEGEKLVNLWETRQPSSCGPKTGEAHEYAIRHWRDLHYSKNFGGAPLLFNRQLQLAVDNLRQIPSIQIIQLQQDQYETPEQYHGRTKKIAIELSNTPSTPSFDMNAHIIQHYVDGIRDEQIRNQVRDFVVSTRTQALRTVARRHKSLHLAADYGRAIERNHYGPEDVSILENYMAILRREPTRSIQRHTEFEYLIPITRNEVVILKHIRQLPDPATLSPNKPKDRFSDSLEFPKSGVGVQCDINFSAYLGIQNTLLLRCYSHTDHRVKPLVLFVKHWAKTRGINTPYRGTLSSYGYVLMMLHYLVNVVDPFVCPNLQLLATPDPPLPPEALEGITTCDGRNVRFWRDEQNIQMYAQQGELNWNNDSQGTLLRGFFEYYAQSNVMTTLPKKGFDWGRDVISLRTHGGLLSKAEKGWTGAKTVVQPQSGAMRPPAESDVTTTQSALIRSNPAPRTQAHAPRPGVEQISRPKEVKEVRHRFLFAIEDPFETDHNVARTVTHNGIVAIRDEFRRAWRIIKAAGKSQVTEDLLEDVKAHKEELGRKQFMALLDEIHGDEVFPDPRVV
ncbi:hypothetical protein NUW58_g4767 [Xylaria curta]|uniref:Uncharacterized protein n=1 Tax=Xylaria curta TaxID=42375 RepID=A0ACC1P4Z1_9PEZI|nr:hypothetical protein NUW58_g4767 [Xylaria curta]